MAIPVFIGEEAETAVGECARDPVVAVPVFVGEEAETAVGEYARPIVCRAEPTLLLVPLPGLGLVGVAKIFFTLPGGPRLLFRVCGVLLMLAEEEPRLPFRPGGVLRLW